MPWWMIPIAIGASAGSSFLSSFLGGGKGVTPVIPNLLPAPQVPVPQISNVNTEGMEGTVTYALSGPINSMASGLPIPILGGRCRVGAQLVAAYIRSTMQRDIIYALYGICEGIVDAVVYNDDKASLYINEDTTAEIIDLDYEEKTGTAAQTATTWFADLHQVQETNVEIVQDYGLVCHFDDDNGVDGEFTNQTSSSYPLSTYGNVVDSVAVKQFGAASGTFPGNAGDYCDVPYSYRWHLASNDFTIDLWLRMEEAATSKWYTIIKWQNTGASTYYGWGLGIKTDAATASTWTVELYSNVNKKVAASVEFTGNDDTFYHLAVVRYGGVVRIYWNGTDITDYASTDWIYQDYFHPAEGTPLLCIGLAYSSASITGECNWYGYMDDLRFVNGKALYTDEFTAPTEAISEYRTPAFISTRGECQEVAFTFDFPSGLYSGSTYATLDIYAYFRDEDWDADEWGEMYGSFTGTHAYNIFRMRAAINSPMRRQVIFPMKCITYDNRSDANTFTIGETITGAVSGSQAIVNYDWDLGSNTGIIYLGHVDGSEDLFVEDEEIEGDTSAYTADVDALPAGVDPIETGKATYYCKSKYQFEFRRHYPPDSPGTSTYCILTTVDEILHYSLGYPHTALLALKFRTNNKIKQIGPISTVADRGSPDLPNWGGGTYARDTSTPAWFALDILTNTRYGRGVSIDDIDQTSWEAWETHTEGAVGAETRARWNGIIDSGMDIDSALELVCRVGRARIIRIGGIYYAVLEKTGTASHLFTAGNMQTGSFVRKDMRYDQKPHAHKVKYKDEDKNYRDREYIYNGPEFETTSEPHRITEEYIIGITNEDEAKRLAILSFQLATFPQSQCVFSAGIDAMSVMPGDIAKVIPDTPYSWGGRVVVADANDVWVDRTVTIPATWQGYLQIAYRCFDSDTIYVEDVTPNGGYGVATDSFRHATANWTDRPEQYDVYAVYHKGFVGHPGVYATEYRVLDIDRSEDITFKLACIEYCKDAYYHADYGATEI